MKIILPLVADSVTKMQIDNHNKPCKGLTRGISLGIVCVERSLSQLRPPKISCAGEQVIIIKPKGQTIMRIKNVTSHKLATSSLT